MPAAKDPVTGQFIKADSTPSPDPKPEQKPDAGAPAADGKEDPKDLSGMTSFVAKYLNIDEKEVAAKPDDKPPEEKPKPKAKPAVKPAAPAPEAPPLTAADIGKAVKDAIDADKKKPDPEPKEKEEEHVSPAIKRKIDVLAKLETLYPKEYKDLSKKFKDGQTKLKTYIAEWGKENPGKEFDSGDPDHEEFFKANDVDWDDAHFEEAQEALIADRVRSEIKKEIDPKLTAVERKEKLREAGPIIAQQELYSAREFWKRMGDDYKDLLDERGKVDMEKLNAMKEADEELYNIRINHAAAAEDEGRLLHTLMNGLEDYDKQNPAHVAVIDFMMQKEKELMGKEQAERLDANGRDFRPADQFYSLPKAERDKYWTFTARDGAALRSRWRANEAKRIVQEEEERFTRRAQRRNLIKKEGDESGQQRQKKPDSGEPDELDPSDRSDGKPISPSSAAKSKLASEREARGGTAKTGIETYVENYLK